VVAYGPGGLGEDDPGDLRFLGAYVEGAQVPEQELSGFLGASDEL
jgi:hypothetical protein